MLSAYPVMLLAGDIEFDHGLVNALGQALQHGSLVLMAGRHKIRLGAGFEALKRKGMIEVLEPWTNTKTGRSTAISDQALKRITRKFQPIDITGAAVQYQINRTESGWVVELVNNNGVIKKPDRAAVVDSQMVAHVRLKPLVKCASAAKWREGGTFENPKEIEVALKPGSSEFVEFVDR